MKNGFVAEYQIMDFDHDDLADGSGKAPISWDMIALYKKILLHKQRIPMAFTIIGINCSSKQFLFRLQPNIILGLNNFTILILLE